MGLERFHAVIVCAIAGLLLLASTYFVFPPPTLPTLPQVASNSGGLTKPMRCAIERGHKMPLARFYAYLWRSRTVPLCVTVSSYASEFHVARAHAPSPRDPPWAASRERGACATALLRSIGSCCGRWTSSVTTKRLNPLRLTLHCGCITFSTRSLEHVPSN
ncbi:hypothetical protein EXIGLDRAFT_136531 [Exidia glandulosa HHB12029]|uniref:Uncharacterized protein n=1 Tax=Exidia glandulosa HHB12029 TaxID=1314781 RepID=A0A165G2E5_EXIGL|nr:hypothetical protein EXIGLDRAFT_136531 [Exidia glandulosa HHB12029]